MANKRPLAILKKGVKACTLVLCSLTIFFVLVACNSTASSTALPPTAVAIISPAPVRPAPTIVYYPFTENPWDKIPVVVISSAKNDPRIPLLKNAVDFWNAQFKAIGTPFHLGSLVETTVQIPDTDLMALGDLTQPGELRPATVALMEKMPGDLIVALSDATFVSVTRGKGAKKLIAIQAHPGGQDSNVIIQNVIAHEIGHSNGLGHNNDPTTLMCGRPATCRPGLDQFVNITGFAPLTVEEIAYLLKIYPPNWKPTP